MQTDKLIPFTLLVSCFLSCHSAFADNNNESDEESALQLNENFDEDLERLNAMHDGAIYTSRDERSEFSAATIDDYEENLTPSAQ